MSKTKINMVPTLVVAALVVAAVGYFGSKGPTGRDRDDDQRNVGLYGTWDPSPRTDGVQVVITVAGSLKVDKTETVAPFARTYPAKKGDRVEIKLTFLRNPHVQDLKGFLGCSITVDGREDVHEYNQTSAPNDPLICWTVLT